VYTYIYNVFFNIRNNGKTYSRSFSFDIHTQVIVQKKHNLSKSQTSSTSYGNTYVGNTNSVSSNKSHYNVDITTNSWFGTEYCSPALLADGYSRTTQYGTVRPKIYAVHVRKQGPSYKRVVGSGHINKKNEKMEECEIMNTILIANNLKKSHINGNVKTDVINNITLSIVQSKINLIMGKSGSGKTTLLNMLSGLDVPDSGELLYNNKSIYDYSESKLANLMGKKFGFLFQNFNLIDELNVYDNVTLPLYYQ